MEMKDILKLINEKKNVKYEGRKYYYYKPKDIIENIDFYAGGKVHSKKVNNTKEVYTNWFKVLVNQKIDYSLSKELTIEKNIPIEFDIDDIIDKLTLNSSLDSRSWLHIIINDSNKLDWTIIKDSQIIPTYDKYNKYIKSIIRFWEVLENENQQSEKITFIQIWTSDKLVEIQIKKDEIISQRISSHYLESLKYQDNEEQINPKNFGFVPFIPLFNNNNKESDIESIKELLDVYNEVCTGFINNIRRFQEMLMKLRGYGGQDLEEFEKQLKKYGVIPVDENGDFDYLKVEIPVEARKTLLDIVKKNIFNLGRGVDPETDFGGNITNVVIKSKYAGLDMKNSDMEKQIRLFYKQLIYVLNTYYNSNIDNTITFNRSQIFNESEQIDNCLKSMGLVSLETILKNHPFVNDYKKEMERVKEDEKKESELNNSHDNTIINNNTTKE